ncbi:11146_t:CDS:2, partial [Acaulospora colombiana]
RAFLEIDAKSLAETASVQIDAPRTSFDSLRGFQFPQSNTSIVLSEDNAHSTPKKEADKLAPSPQPFIFGSPANGVSNAQFGNAAASILEEMNKRLGIATDSSAAARIDADGAINFGEITPSRQFALKLGNKREDNGRFGKAHEKIFDHVKQPVPTIGTKRKSMVAFGEEGVPKKPQGTKRAADFEANKDNIVPPPPAKRQKVDGATLAEMEQKNKSTTSAVAKIGTKEQEEIAKKTTRTQQRRRSSRLSAGGPAARAKAVTAGAAKVMKSIISSVAGTTQPSSSKPTIATASKTQTKPLVKGPQKQSALSSVRPVPIPEEPSRVKGDTKSSKATLASEVATRKTRESNLVPRTSSNDVSARSSLNPGTRATKTTLAPKAPVAPKFTRTSTGPRRGALPSFEDPKKGAQTEGSSLNAATKNSGSTSKVSSISNRPSGTITRPKLTVRNNRISGTKTDATSNTKSSSARSSLATSSQTRRASKPATREASVSSKVELQSVPEAQKQPEQTNDNRDFEPKISRDPYDFDDSRASSPLPTPPASLSSKPLQRRKPLEPVQPSDENPGTNSSITSKPRKSAGAGLTAKAKLMGGETAAKARASAAADAAKRRMRLSEAAAARRRTMAK